MQVAVGYDPPFYFFKRVNTVHRTVINETQKKKETDKEVWLDVKLI